MDYTLIALAGVLVLTAVLSTRLHSRTWSGRPGYQYQRIITLGVFGLWLTVAGAIGWDVSRVHGFFQGTRWVEAPVWWELGVGLVLLGVAVLLGRRVSPHASRSVIR